jgi:hypothetical protein
MRRITHLLVLAAFIFSCGGQWYALQCVAWATMIRDYAQVVPLSEAVSMTFSGNYPCEMCKAIAEKKAADDRAKLVSLEKYDKKFFPPNCLAIIGPAPSAISHADYLSSLQPRTESPPTPPPRLA